MQYNQDKRDAMKVNLDIFEGPMDLLLHLIKKDNIDIYDINISDITKQYLEYLQMLKDLNLDVAGEFLVMASSLMQVKAKMLLPSYQTEFGDEGPDPAKELIERILEYQKFKSASEHLRKKFEVNKDKFYKTALSIEERDKVLNIETFELFDALKRALDRAKDKDTEQEITVEAEQFRIEDKMDKIVNIFANKEWVLVDDIFGGETKTQGVISCFLALLELIKIRKLLANQDNEDKEIRIYLRPENKNIDHRSLLNLNNEGEENE